MNVLSLFDGISCGQVALQRAGISVDNYYASEIDKNAIAITQKNFPKTIQLGSVTELTENNVPKVDLLIGGSPCTGFSIAGKGLNFDDPHSKLFFEYVRILNIVKPKYFLLENVKMKKEWEDIISNELKVPPILIDSADFSAQGRKRVYWTNLPIKRGWDKSSLTVADILQPESEVDGKYLIPSDRAITICDQEVTRKKIAYLGNGSRGERIYSIFGKSISLTALGGGLGVKTEPYAIPGINLNFVHASIHGPRFRPDGSKMFTLTTVSRHGVIVDGHIRRITPIESERLQTLPDNYTFLDNLKDCNRYKALGNGWTVDVIAYILKELND
jgi:DNA (cytosine-5)-methyltransferase 3A